MSGGPAFGSVAAAYDAGRPGYADEAVRAVLPRMPCTAVDVGAGTGKLTSALVHLGCEVVAVEPDDEMRALIRGVDARAGSAEALPLPDGSVDAVVAGHALHWFDAERFVGEALRVLRPGGTIGILRNDLDDRFEWIDEFGRAAGRLVGPVLSADLTAPPLDDRRLGPPAYTESKHAVPADVVRVLDLVKSYSTVFLLPAGRRAELLAEVEQAVRARFGDSGFELPYVTRAWRYERG